jgi:hypothetical protein
MSTIEVGFSNDSGRYKRVLEPRPARALELRGVDPRKRPSSRAFRYRFRRDFSWVARGECGKSPHPGRGRFVHSVGRTASAGGRRAARSEGPATADKARA